MRTQYIAESIFNRLPPLYTFKDNIERHINESKNVLYFNRDMEKEIAYFRYADGSTMHLSGQVAYHSAPCTECSDIQQCNCTLKFDLRKRDELGNVIDTTELIEELTL